MLSFIFTLISVFGISIIASTRIANLGIPTRAAVTLERLKTGYYVFNYAYGAHYHFVLPSAKDHLNFDDPVLIMINHKGGIDIKLPNGSFIHDGWITQMDIFTSREHKKLVEWFFENKDKFDSQDHEAFMRRVKIGKH